jgi:molybdopterin-synthase adenylyltransferase
MALARAGVGRLRLIDRDYVEWSNLQRQWLFTEDDAREGRPKAIAAARAIGGFNSGIEALAEAVDLTAANIDELLDGAHLILDGTDNFETRYLINDYAVSRHVPWIYGAAVGSYGISMPVMPGRSSCFQCVYPQAPSGAQPTCETAGVINAITSAVASIQTGDALRYLVTGDVALRITTLDVWSGTARQVVQPDRDPQCRACGRGDLVFLRGDKRAPISLCGRNAVQIHERARPLDLRDLAARLGELGDVRVNEFALRFVASPYEMTIFPDGRAIIKGTTDTGLARSLYARYVGG